MRERYEWVVELLLWSSVGLFGLSQTHPPQMPGYEAPCSLHFEVHGLDGDLNNFAFSQVMIYLNRESALTSR